MISTSTKLRALALTAGTAVGVLAATGAITALAIRGLAQRARWAQHLEQLYDPEDPTTGYEIPRFSLHKNYYWFKIPLRQPPTYWEKT